MSTPTEKQKQEWLTLAKFFLDEHGVDIDVFMQIAELAFKDGIIHELKRQLEQK